MNVFKGEIPPDDIESNDVIDEEIFEENKDP
jgi:hypothetical protein